MSKTIGKVLAVGAVVVGVIAAIPTAGASLGLSAAALSALSVGIAAASLLNSAIVKSGAKNQLQARQASVVALQLGEVPREALFGEALTGGSLVDAFNYGGQYGTDWECRVIALADHRCEALTGFYVNDVYVPFTGDGPVAGYNGQLEVYWRPGSSGQTVPAVVLANGPGWTPSDIGYGVCWVAVCYKADKADAKTPVWPAGRAAFAWLVRGKRCYQARRDGSVGGSGAHRWNDPSTWEWTDNAIDCRYNWVRGVYAGDQVDQPGMLLVGRGLSTIEAPPTNVFASANVCDEAVALDAGGTERRYRTSGVIRADETYIDVEEHFAAACGGVILQPEGAVEIEPGQAKAPVFFFSDDDLLVGSSVDFTTDLPDSSDAWVNTVVPRYTEPTLKYADHAAPVRRLVADIVADGGPREQSLSLSLVTSATQAGRVGEIARRMGRLLARARVTLGPVFAEVEEGDWGVWTSQRYLKGGSMLVRVEAYALDERWQNTLNLRRIATGVYARDADAGSTSSAFQQEPISPISAPGPTAWAASADLLAQGTSSIPAIVITGAVDNDYVELVRFEYWPDDGATDPALVSTWIEASVAGPDARRSDITSVAPNTSYFVAVSYMVGRLPGPRRILGPVTTGRGTLDFDGVTGPKRPDDNATNSANPNSPFGPGGTVGATIDRLSAFDQAIAAAKARQDQLDTVIIPAIGDAVADAGERISAAQARADKAVADANAVDRRVDAFVAQGGYDDTDVRAEIRTVATVAANANQGVADLSTSVGASFRGVSDTLANYDERITTLATGSDSFASRASALEASSRADTAMLNGNGNFSDWPDARGTIPTGWGLASAAAGTSGRRVPGILGRYGLETGWAGSSSPANFFYAVSGLNFGDPYGGIDAGMFGGPGWYVMEADVTLVSGSLVGSGLYCAAYNADGNAQAIGYGHFPESSANGGGAPGAGQEGARYRFAILVDFNAPGTRSFRFHPMVVWESFVSSSPAKTLTWHKAGLRAATPQEIAARRADTNASSALARVGATEDALADLPNRYAAASRTAALEAQVNFAADSGLQRTINSRIEDRATVIADGKLGAANQRMDVMVSEYNGIGARVEQQAGTIAGLDGKAVAYVRIIADAGNGRASLSLWSDQYGGAWSLGGNGLIDGNLTITGTLTARTMDYGSVGEMSIYYDTTSQSFNSQTSWIDIATLALTSRQGQPIEGFFTCILTNLGGTSTQVQARVVRLEDGTPIWGGSGGILIAARDEGESMTASFFDSLGAGTTGTYAVQMKKKAGASNTVSAAYRSMRLVEMSRNKFQQIVINTPAGEGPGRGTYGGGSINGGGYGLGNFNLQ